MDGSILNVIKHRLGPDVTYNYFDTDIIMDINASLMVLNQLGVGPLEGFSITSDAELWSEFLGDDLKRYEAVQTYVYLKARLVFDPPQTGPLMEAMERRVAELEWRLNVQTKEVASNGG